MQETCLSVTGLFSLLDRRKAKGYRDNSYRLILYCDTLILWSTVRLVEIYVVTGLMGRRFCPPKSTHVTELLATHQIPTLLGKATFLLFRGLGPHTNYENDYLSIKY